MIGSIGSSGFQPPVSSSSSSGSNQASLSLEQQQVIEDTLANYDASSLSESDAQAIVTAFQDAGIKPSKELEEAMDSLGFSAKEVGELSGMGGPKGAGGPPPSEEEFDTVSSLLESLFSSDEEDEESTISLDDVMDYTSRILSLNEESKQEVMDLFEQYSSDSSELSSADTASVITNSLSQILNDSNNYKRTSFYA